MYLLNYKNSLQKRTFFDHRVYKMYLKFLQKPRCLCWFKTSQALWSAVKKTRLSSTKDNFIAKSCRLSTKRKLNIFLNFLFPFVFYQRIFNLEIQNFSVENHHMIKVAEHSFGILWVYVICQIMQEKGCSSQAETWQVRNILMNDCDWQVKSQVFVVSMATWTIEYNLEISLLLS